MGGKNFSPIYHFGVFANMREIYLRKYKPALYERYRKSGELENHLKTFQAHHAVLAEQLHQKLAAERGVTHELLRLNFTEWIARTAAIQEEVRAYMVKLITQEELNTSEK